ncbi:MAG: 30S ribosomal protein S11 [Patescibacteria group bacterium]
MATKKTNVKTVATKKIKKKLSLAKINIYAGFNNTIITLADPAGAVLAWASSGKMGFKGSRKSTPFAAQKAVEEILLKLSETGATAVNIVVKGVGSGRDQAIRTIASNQNIDIQSIHDVTPVPHGGVRSKKRRRV